MAWKNRKEGKMTRMIESQTAKVPSVVFLCAAGACAAAAITLKCLRKGKAGLMVGQFIAPMMLLGVYDKIVKTGGHDMHHKHMGDRGSRHMMQKMHKMHKMHKMGMMGMMNKCHHDW